MIITNTSTESTRRMSFLFMVNLEIKLGPTVNFMFMNALEGYLHVGTEPEALNIYADKTNISNNG